MGLGPSLLGGLRARRRGVPGGHLLDRAVSEFILQRWREMSKERRVHASIEPTIAGADTARRPLIIELIATLTRRPRRISRKLVHRAEALIHPWRLRRATRAILGRRPIQSVVVLCYGNICRSPYAEARLEERLLEMSGGARHDLRVSSAGFYGPGRPSTDMAIESARLRGIDLLDHRSQTVATPFLASYDLILVMTQAQIRATKKVHREAFVIHLGDLDPVRPTQRDIPDPYGHAGAVFSDVYARIDRTIETLAPLLHTGSSVGGRP